MCRSGVTLSDCCCGPARLGRGGTRPWPNGGISAAIAASDPLEPWLVVSNYDEHYWNDVALAAVPAIAEARNEEEVFAGLVEALGPLMRISDSDPYSRDRVRQAAAALWRWRTR